MTGRRRYSWVSTGVYRQSNKAVIPMPANVFRTLPDVFATIFLSRSSLTFYDKAENWME